MRSTMSYTKIGIFSLAAYPYSFKLLWSPIVDTIFSKSIGRRKSWIIPLQIIAAITMMCSGSWVELKMKDGDAYSITALFFALVLLAATQDIAVDGWALTLLSKKNVGYAATCQTVGMNIGYFTSFTIFLALSDPEFCSSYFHTPVGVPLITLAGYMRFWGWVYLVVTAGIALFKSEDRNGGQSTVGHVLLSQLWSRRRGAKNSSIRHSHRDRDHRRRLKGPHYSTSRNDSSSLVGAEAGEEWIGSGGGSDDDDGTSNGGGRTTATNGGVNSNGTMHMARRRSLRLQEKSAASAAAAAGLREEQRDEPREEREEDVREAYVQLWGVVKLPSVRLLALLLLIARLGMLAAESAAPLKLLEKGASKEALAGLVLVEFPIELLSAVIAGRWAASSHPLRPYFTAYKLRLALAAATATAVYTFPPGAASLTDAPIAFGILAIIGVATSFSSTLMFTALGDFFNRISDPAMGGGVFDAVEHPGERRCGGS